MNLRAAKVQTGLVLLVRSRVHPSTWVCMWDGTADLTSFLHAGPLRTMKRWAETEHGIVRWRHGRDNPDDWEGWTE